MVAIETMAAFGGSNTGRGGDPAGQGRFGRSPRRGKARLSFFVCFLFLKLDMSLPKNIYVLRGIKQVEARGSRVEGLSRFFFLFF